MGGLRRSESIHEEGPLLKKRKVKPAFTPKYQGPTKNDILAARKQHLSDGQYTFYKEPLMLVEGAMQYIFDEQGRRYLDAYSNVCHIGHCHPHVVEAVQKAMATVLTNTRYLHPTIATYAERLKQRFPPELDTVFFVNSGSEANDLAVRLARVHTQRSGVVALQHAYHGTTAVCTGLSTCLAPGTGGGCIDWKYCARDIWIAPCPDLVRGAFRKGDPKAAEGYADMVQSTIQSKCPDDVAAFIAESIQGVGGQVVYPPGYLKAVYERVRAAGGVCIADEVQVGFGRTGQGYWGFETQGVVPDIVTLGKPIGNGFPLAAVVVKRHIARSFDDCQYFNTAGGNPVSCAAGLAVLESIDEDDLQENARAQGEYCMQLLEELKARHRRIGDVRGMGLFIGVELMKDGHGLEPAPEATAWVFERCKELGLLIGKGGPYNNVLRIKPPICVTRADIEFLVGCLARALQEEQEMEEQGRMVVEPSAADVDLLVYNYLKQNGFGHLATQFKQETGGLKKEGNPYFGLKLQSILADATSSGRHHEHVDYEGAQKLTDSAEGGAGPDGRPEAPEGGPGKARHAEERRGPHDHGHPVAGLDP